MSSLLDRIFIIQRPGIQHIGAQMELGVRHIEAQRHGLFRLALKYQVLVGRNPLVHASRSRAAGHMHGSLRIHHSAAGSVVILCIRFAFPVRKRGAGIDRVMAGNHQVNIVIFADISQRLTDPGIQALLIPFHTAVGRIVLDDDPPFRIRMLRHHLGTYSS